jgi:dihydropteroate synthase
MNQSSFDFTFRNGEKMTIASPALMQVINLTPDSFFDGDPKQKEESIWEKIHLAHQAGAMFVDLGGESTRPGAKPVPLHQEIARVVPWVQKIKQQFPHLIISVDTSKASVAAMALDCGAEMINDVSAGESSEGAIFELCAKHQATCVLMHKKGDPENMQEKIEYLDVVSEVKQYLGERILFAESKGLLREKIILDPGIGFGKTAEHNLSLLKHFSQFSEWGRPLLLGVSMKSIVGHLTGKEVKERLAGTLGLQLAMINRGVSLFRVHHAWAMRDAMKTFTALQNEST